MVPWRYNQTVVRRLRVKGHKLDPLAAQLHLDNLLQTVEMHPSWLPSSTIVCLRRLHDPMPRALNLQSRAPREPFAWQEAVSASVQEEIRRAVRPVNVAVSPDTNAVIFKDRSELLVCLAMDWLEGCVREHWWWRSLIKDQFVGNIVPDAWSNAPQYVPAALELLAVKRGLESFVHALSVDRARALLQDVTRSFGLAELHAALDEGFEQMRHDSGDEKTSSLQFEDASADSRVTGAQTQPTAPWHQLVPESWEQTLGLKRQCLIGIALTIRRAPAAVHSLHFARATLKWLRTAATVQIISAGNSNESQDRNASPERDVRVNVRDKTRPSMSSDAVRERLPSEQIHLVQDAIESSAENERRPHGYEDLPQSLTSSSSSNVNLNRGSEEEIASRLSESTSSPTLETSPASFSEKSYVEIDPDLLALDEVRVETQFGGIFYLVNLGLFLELYADFTTPLGKSLELSIFNFIDLTARRLLNEKITKDPVWTLLAQLSGQSEFDVPGHEFEPPEEWRLPPRWLEAFPDESRFEWMIEGKRLCVRHAAGFLILDMPLSGEDQLQREMVAYESSAEPQLIRKSFRVSRSSNSLDQWLDWIVPYVRARLCRAFGIDDASNAATLLCRQPASIRLTAVHLDVFFSLSEHPLEIRLAGLDRDPGWVPAAGRFIRFHYQ